MPQDGIDSTPGSGPRMNVTVAGLWHLGCVTAACAARHFQVTGLDFDPANVASLAIGKAPLYEPQLDETLAQGLHSGRLRFSSNAAEACAQADILWVTMDTPVNDQDEAQVEEVFALFERTLPHLKPGTLVLVSSQIPVGTCARLEQDYPRLDFACAPENLRLGKAIECFCKPERVVLGVRHQRNRPLLEALFQPFSSNLIWVRPESAEMVKHALNSFLALSIVFINEISRLCEHTGADAREVAAGLKSDPRIGPRAYLNPGVAFAGGTLARDVVVLSSLAHRAKDGIAVIPAIKPSNDHHRRWAFNRLQSKLGRLDHAAIAVLGLTYTPNTNTLRRSAAIELCRSLVQAGCAVRAFDPVVKALPQDLTGVQLTDSVLATLQNADAAVLCTEWPEFRTLHWPDLLPQMHRPLIVDPNGFLDQQLGALSRVEYLCVGRPAEPRTEAKASNT